MTTTTSQYLKHCPVQRVVHKRAPDIESSRPSQLVSNHSHFHEVWKKWLRIELRSPNYNLSVLIFSSLSFLSLPPLFLDVQT